MTVHLRVKGHYDPGEVVHCTPEVLAEFVERTRRLEAESVPLKAHSELLKRWRETLRVHGADSEEFDDVVRDVDRAMAA